MILWSVLLDSTMLFLCFLSSVKAFAEKLHEEVRVRLWGYAANEVLDASQLHKISYQVNTSCHRYNVGLQVMYSSVCLYLIKKFNFRNSFINCCCLFHIL